MKNNPNDLIGLMTDQGPDQLTGALGILKCGYGFVPIDPDYPLDRIEFMICDSGIDIMVTEARHLDKMLRISGGHHPLKHIICLDRLEKEISAPDGVRIYDSRDFQDDVESGEDQSYNAGPGRIAYLVYTSGSTGKPKGVPITH